MVDLSEADAKKWRPLLDQIARAHAGLAVPDVSTAEKYRAVKGLCQRQNRLDDDSVGALVSKYKGGATVYELADQFDCHRTTISSVLKAQGVEVRHAPMAEEQVDRAAELYASGLSLAKVGQLMCVNAETVRQRLLKRGVALRGPNEKR